jgi:hypothetical protein
MWDCDYTVVDGLCISNSSMNDIGIKVSFHTIRNCWIVNHGWDCIDASNPTNSNNIIENNLMELSGRGVPDGIAGHRYHSLYISGPNNIIRNNVLRHNSGYGIHLYTGYPGGLAEQQPDLQQPDLRPHQPPGSHSGGRQ